MHVELHNLVLFITYCYGDHIKEDGMVGEWTTHGRCEEGIHIIYSKNLKGSDHLKDLNVNVNTMLKGFENRVLRRIFGPKRNEVTGDWRKLHNEELHNLYSSPSIMRMIKSRRLNVVAHVARVGERRNAYRILVGKPEGERPLGRLRSRWMDNIKMDLREVGWDCMDWIDLAQDRD
jgi:hypothetical protein